ncbi:hypothetical protein K2173_008919 [Erythroxylum novogranatense]|uniref:Uncharacterized protein n=1 Tax=Erythroxylum novogranatense TaxID=1862640 RepID=A0AAV8S4Y3_9ROSI|nr:hypothetical protein K2173_008919 [Erythroxylum novogranatense]
MTEDMKFEVEALSQDLVKPSFPTTQHRRYHQLSCIDQMMITMYMPWLFYYPASDNSTNKEETCERVKRSLSEALTVFYPLAGRFRENKYVDCNDEGVHFVEAKAKCNIQDILQNPNSYDINKLLPFDMDHVSDEVACVQVTHFDCGGMTIGFAMCHKMGDALSSIMFLQAWSAISRGEGIATIVPLFDSAKHFAPVNLPEFDRGFVYKRENFVTKRFVFDLSSLSAIRDRYAYRDNMNEETIRPTRVEALTAYMWSKINSITEVKASKDKVITACHSVNLRPRMNLPFSEQQFGNLVLDPEVMKVEDNNTKSSCDDLMVRKMRETLGNLNAEYVKNLQAGNTYFDMIKKRSEKMLKGEMVVIDFTSCCRFPIYEIDFGWGKPEWVSSTRCSFGNFVGFFDTKVGGGIEAWITLTKEEMTKFEADGELIAFSSPEHKH